MVKPLVLTVRQVANCFIERVKNKLSCEAVVTGPRGGGKSTLADQLFWKLPGFNPEKHQVYGRKDIITLLEGQRHGLCFGDELINAAYKRQFFDQEQQKLIRVINMYRDNFNIFIGCLPLFYNLDKDFRNLIKFNLQVVSRGLAILHMARSNLNYIDDPWDVKYNKKLEESWVLKKKKNPKFKFPYHKLSTFVAYVTFKDLTPKRREQYEEIKRRKRKILYDEEMGIMKVENNKSVAEFIVSCLEEGLFTDIKQINKLIIKRGLRPDQVRSAINYILRNDGRGSITQVLKENSPKINDKELPSDEEIQRSKI